MRSIILIREIVADTKYECLCIDVYGNVGAEYC